MNVTSLMGTTPTKVHTTMMSLITAFSEKFFKAWNVEIFPSTTLAKGMRNTPYRMFCGQGALELPDPALEERQPIVRAKMSYQWGRSCETDQKATYKLKMETNPDQENLIESSTSLEEKCRNHVTERGVLSEDCLEAEEQRGDLRTTTLELTHNGIEKRWKMPYYKAVSWLTDAYSRQASIDHVDVYNEPNAMLLKWSVFEKNYLDLMIKNPFETIEFTRMNLPFVFPTYNFNHHLSFLAEKVYGTCKINYNGEIRRFDNREFEVHLTECYHLLAEDKTVHQNFAVLSHMCPVLGGATKDLLVFLKGWKIEMKHCNEGNLELFVKNIKYINQTNEVIILTNGTVLEQVKEKGDSVLRRWKTEISDEDGASKSDFSDMISTVSDATSDCSDHSNRMTRKEQMHFASLTEEIKEKMVKEEATSLSNVKVLAIISFDEHQLNIHSELLGMHIRFDGKNAILKVAPNYHQDVCGICGGLINEEKNKFIGPDKTVYHDWNQAARSYEFVTDSCRIPSQERVRGNL